MDTIKTANLALSFLLELAALVLFGYWGFTAGAGTAMKVVLGLGAPLLMIVVWALFVAPHAAVSLPTSITLVLGFLILVLAAIALAVTGHRMPALAFAVIVLLNAVLAAVWRQQQ